MQLFDIILFALIAVFLVLRLRGVLGSRDGHEGRNDRGESNDNPFGNPFKRDQDEGRDNTDNNTDDNIIELPGPRSPDAGFTPVQPQPAPAEEEEEEFTGPLGEGVKAIRIADPTFVAKDFVDGSQFAFEMILNAYADGDVKTLKSLLSADVYGGFAQAIEDREAAGQTLQETLVGINSAELVEAYMDGRDANVTVKFVSEQISALMDSEGAVIDGDLTQVVKATDFWTFARSTKSRNPNWTLVGTGALE